MSSSSAPSLPPPICTAPASKLPIEAEPGERAEYSDPGFILLGKALEVLTREALPGSARETDFPTAGDDRHPILSSVRTEAPDSTHRRSTTSFRHRRIQGEVQDENAYILNGAAGHAGLFSNVPDLLRFAGEILQQYSMARSTLFHSRYRQRRLLSGRPRRQFPRSGLGYAFAESSAGQYFSPHSIGHLGFSGCSLWIDLDASVAAVLLTNRTWPDRQCQLIREVRPAFHDAVRVALSGRQPL